MAEEIPLMPPPALPFSAHYFLMVDNGRGVTLRDFLTGAFFADVIHQHWRMNVENARPRYLLTAYLRVRHTRTIIQLHEVFRQPILENESNGVMCVYVANAEAAFNTAIGLGAENIEDPDYIGQVQLGQSRIYRIRDPCGFVWCIASMDMVPQVLRPLRGCYIHYMLFIDRTIARQAFDWYRYAYGAVVVEEFHAPIATARFPRIYLRYLLRIGTEARHVMLEIVETYNNPINAFESHERIYIFTDQLMEFIQRIQLAGGGAIIEQEQIAQEPDQPSIFRVTDPYDYHWQIESVNTGIPNEVLYPNNILQ